MSVIQTSTSRQASNARQRLHDKVRHAALRGRLLASLRIALLCVAGVVGGLFVLAVKDALFVMPADVRVVMLGLLVLGLLGVFAVLALRPWFNQRFSRNAGEQIDQAARQAHQPVTVGLSLGDPMDDDSLARALLLRAETHAAEIAQSVKPSQAYPLHRLRGPSGWLALTIGLWLLLAIVLPSQVLAMFSRVAMPWGAAPPFSLTQLEPTWSPKPPDAGGDVWLTVEPSGRIPESVDWVRLDSQGNEAERFAMAADGEGGFSLLLERVESPIIFRLEAFGRHTRTYAITPTPRPPAQNDDMQEPDDDASSTSQGATTYDPDKVARRDLSAHRDWPGIKAKLEQLISDLGNAQATAERLDPSDAEAMQGLADTLAELTAEAGVVADQLDTIHGDLPAEAAALIAALQDALRGLRSAALPAPPSPGQGVPGSGDPTAADWLKQAADAAKSDQQSIGQGIGPSDQPTDSGTASGQPGEGPDFRDPSTTGTHVEQNTTGDAGPLPDAVMQQVPLRYRDFVSAYFKRLAEEQDNP